MTNFEKITKDAETLLNTLINTLARKTGPICPPIDCKSIKCRDCWINWLNKEVEEKKDA